jgi:hypothetical protein
MKMFNQYSNQISEPFEGLNVTSDLWYEGRRYERLLLPAARNRNANKTDCIVHLDISLLKIHGVRAVTDRITHG